MSSARKVKVTIFGEAYTLVTDEPEEAVRATVSKVDELMLSIAHRMGNVEARKVAVFAALQLASKHRELDQLVEAKVRQCVDQIDHALLSD
jgi:cell division protein ZapA (FtsZ GTPase activity inhibitor)